MKVFTLIIFVLISGVLSVTAQTSDRELGIEAFNQKKFAEAIGFFEKAVKTEGEDITSLFYLGQSFENLGKKNEAVKNYTLCYQKGLLILEKTLFEVVSSDDASKNNSEYVKNKIGDKIELALKSGERIEIVENNSAQNINLQDALLIFNHFLKERPTIPKNFSENGENKKLKITDKPNPYYTKQARKNLTTGAVHLYVMFLANGRIGLVIPRILLPDGLTQESIEAARKLKFEPQIVNGKPVTVIKTVVYNFIA